MPKAAKKMSQNPQKNSFRNTSSQTSQGKHFLKICTWTKKIGEAEFYIQSKGLHAGRPLNEPIPNCWAVFTSVPYLFQIAESIYASGHLNTLLIGSVIPFIRLTEYRPILSKAVEFSADYDLAHLETLDVLKKQMDHYEKQVHLLREYHRLVCLTINRKSKVI